MFNLIKIIIILIISIFISTLLIPLFIVLIIEKKCNFKTIKKIYKLWLN